jgi:hypothetical protein
VALKTTWRMGTPRPTEQQPPRKVRWWRSRKDPFEAIWPEIRSWAATDPDLTGRQLLQRLQARYPGAHPDGQLRTLQRRLKEWRREMAHDLVLGSSPAAPDIGNNAIVLAAIKDEPFGWPLKSGHP